MPKLSVVTPTYNRRARLARVLKALEGQTVAPSSFETVVVDDGSTDGTSDWLADYRGPLDLRRLTLKNGGPARARNAGVEAASGELILFIDDDVEPCPVLVEEHLGSHDLDADVVVMGPLASLPHYDQPWITWEQAKVEAQYAAMTRGDWAPTFRQFWTGNASLSRAHLLAAGLFDASYLRAEDIELGLRLHERGVGFRFNPRARGLHYAERSLSSWELAHSSYGKNEVEIFGRMGDDELVDLLAANWRRSNPAMRLLVKSCIGRPLRHSLARRVLHAHLSLAERMPVALLAQPACSLLASLLYWQASAETLGPERARRVLGFDVDFR